MSADLPTETELIEGELYEGENPSRYGRWFPDAHTFYLYRTPDGSVGFPYEPGSRWHRLGRVAKYRPAPAEPAGIGAVVRDRNDVLWILADDKVGTARWLKAGKDRWRYWSGMDQPVEVLSEGVVL